MECPLIVLLVGSAVLSAGCGTPGRRLARRRGLRPRPSHVIVVQGAVADVSWAAWARRFSHPAPRRCGELRAATGGQLPELLLGSAAQPKGPQIAKTSRRDA